MSFVCIQYSNVRLTTEPNTRHRFGRMFAWHAMYPCMFPSCLKQRSYSIASMTNPFHQTRIRGHTENKTDYSNSNDIYCERLCGIISWFWFSRRNPEIVYKHYDMSWLLSCRTKSLSYHRSKNKHEMHSQLGRELRKTKEQTVPKKSGNSSK